MTKAVQPPRPPNAWILYRADKAKEIGRKAQADVSREISLLWRNERPEIRAEYERRADIKKAEHQLMYPQYRFQPVKREEKERIRQQKRLDKERRKQEQRQARSRQKEEQVVAVPQPNPHLYSTYDQRYGPHGPSPPLSAAASPQSTVAELPPALSLPPAAYPSIPTPEPDPKDVIAWPAQQQQFVEFDLPPPNTPFDPMQPWTGTLSSSEFEHAMMSSTANQGVFELSGFNPESLLSNPTGELEISMSSFDMTPYSGDVHNLSDIGLFASPQQDDFTSFLASFGQAPAENYEATADQFLNLEPEDAQQPIHTPYVPPSGASQSNTRRVGGTWPRPSSPLTSPIDTRPTSWSLHA
uniref:HMG box domain-containing protein n=1 Tax=Mycena chlorophos TaxID=658473 RepID=A0ABQ0M2V7_MYCCL|nr:predicted protein [Mycena chlorophos]